MDVCEEHHSLVAAVHGLSEEIHGMRGSVDTMTGTMKRFALLVDGNGKEPLTTRLAVLEHEVEIRRARSTLWASARMRGLVTLAVVVIVGLGGWMVSNSLKSMQYDIRTVVQQLEPQGVTLNETP